MSEGLPEEIGEGCLYAIFDATLGALPWQVSVGLLAVLVVIWLVAGHPGL